MQFYLTLTFLEFTEPYKEQRGILKIIQIQNVAIIRPHI